MQEAYINLHKILSSLCKQLEKHFTHILSIGLQGYSVSAVSAEAYAPNFSSLNSPLQN